MSSISPRAVSFLSKKSWKNIPPQIGEALGEIYDYITDLEEKL